MRTDQERLSLLYCRADELRKRRNRIQLRAWCGISTSLLACLVCLTAWFSGSRHSITADMDTASSLLSANAGGYVLVAVAAFMAGVIVTTAIIWKRKRTKDFPGNNEEKTGEENTVPKR